MNSKAAGKSARLMVLLMMLGMVLVFFSALLALSFGSSVDFSVQNFRQTLLILLGRSGDESVMATIIWQIRMPRVLLASAVGASLSLGGLVFQALLRNALAEPYILGVSGGAAIGAITGIIMGFSMFPGVTLSAFVGSMAVLVFVLALAAGVVGRPSVNKDSLLLGGVMMNAFCAAAIMFLISLTRSSQAQQILFWLMGDFSAFANSQLPILLVLLPCFAIIFILARPMNIMLMGGETAAALGVNVRQITMVLLVTTSFMVSVVVCQSGLVGFVGLVIPHIFRQMLGPDHRLLIPSCLLGGASYMILCDLLSRTVSAGGEMPVGVITALIGAPLFIFMLWRAKK